MKKIFLVCLELGIIIFPLIAFQDIPLSVANRPPPFQVIPVAPTPQTKNVLIKTIFPRMGENKRKAPINVQMRVKDFPLGFKSPFERAEELYNNPDGQMIHVIVDNEPYLAFNQTIDDGFNDLDQKAKDRILSFYIPQTLRPGQHILRIFPARSYGESLKGEGCFDTQVFYFLDQKMNHVANVDLEAPYLTYNEPQGYYPRHKGDPLLLDFIVSNCKLSSTGYKVRLTINKIVSKVLTKEAPYYIYGLTPGKHLVKLELLDERNQVAPGFFNVTEREIIIQK